MEGKIMSAAEWETKSYNLAAEYATRGDWEAFCHIVKGRYQIMDQCFKDF